MIVWNDRFYIDSELKDAKKTKKLINKNKYVKGVFCVSIASNDKNIFDIINVNELLFDYYKKGSINIVGLAKSRKNAVNLVAKIVEEVYTETGDFNIRDYFDNIPKT